MLTLFVCTWAVAEQPASQRLTLKDAIDLALKNNLNVLVAGTQAGEAAGSTERAFSTLLPHVSGDVLENRQNRNLETAGISLPAIPTVVGPFSFTDFRVFASQTLVDRQAYHSWKSAARQESAARLTYQDARDLIVRQTTGLYLNSEFYVAEAQAAQSRVETSETLEKLTRDQRGQGLATGVDVVRAQVQLARDQQVLLLAQNNYQTSLLELARFLGLPPGTSLELAEQLQFHQVAIPEIDKVLPTALQSRADYRAVLAQREALVEQQKASHARYLPKLLIGGDYGALGRNFGSMPGIGQIQATASITLFDRDRNGEQQQLENRLRRIDAQANDLARGIEQELRKAMLDLQSTAKQVKVTEAGLELAGRELELARDRFHNGVADNIEVVTAQDALAIAQNDRLGALARHADAEMELIRALGGGEKNYLNYLAQP